MHVAIKLTEADIKAAIIHAVREVYKVYEIDPINVIFAVDMKGDTIKVVAQISGDFDDSNFKR